jgi:hypothetical protein
VLSVTQVLPKNLALGLGATRYWFVIGGQAVRCFVPYRPSRDADFGVLKSKDLKSLVAQLQQLGPVELLEMSKDTAHLNFDGIDVSIFVLPLLASHVQDQVLTTTGILATKTHAILDRGTRRDFFDLYVMLQTQGLGIASCLHALAHVYATEINHSLVLRALCYFEDADSEAPLPGEGRSDWELVQAFFSKAVAALIVPPITKLQVQTNVVDVTPLPDAARSKRSPAAPRKRRPQTT